MEQYRWEKNFFLSNWYVDIVEYYFTGWRSTRNWAYGHTGVLIGGLSSRPQLLFLLQYFRLSAREAASTAAAAATFRERWKSATTSNATYYYYVDGLHTVLQS